MKTLQKEGMLEILWHIATTNYGYLCSDTKLIVNFLDVI